MPEENGNGKNGNRVGLLERVKAGMKEDVQSLKTDMPAKAKEQIEGLKDPTKTQVYTSIFRDKHDETPRNRALGVLSQRLPAPASRPRSIATPCATTTPGAWAASRSTSSSC